MFILFYFLDNIFFSFHTMTDDAIPPSPVFTTPVLMRLSIPVLIILFFIATSKSSPHVHVFLDHIWSLCKSFRRLQFGTSSFSLNQIHFYLRPPPPSPTFYTIRQQQRQARKKLRDEQKVQQMREQQQSHFLSLLFLQQDLDRLLPFASPPFLNSKNQFDPTLPTFPTQLKQLERGWEIVIAQQSIIEQYTYITDLGTFPLFILAHLVILKKYSHRRTLVSICEVILKHFESLAKKYQSRTSKSNVAQNLMDQDERSTSEDEC